MSIDANTWRNKQFDLPKPYGTWVVENVFFKLVAGEGHGISAMDAALQQTLRLQERRLDPSDVIKTIKVRTNASANMIINRSGDLRNPADRDHCLQYMVAVVILKGAIPEAADYADESPCRSSWSPFIAIFLLFLICRYILTRQIYFL